ncbi:MAG: hypothetical protein R2856_15745 [Caldilineaceae bacterium]
MAQGVVVGGGGGEIAEQWIEQGTWPEIGSQRSCNPTKRISMIPSQKLGNGLAEHGKVNGPA